MPQYFTPGVYIEEIERGPRPIEGVPTSTAAFLGESERGPTMPRLVTSYNDYRRWFGDIFGTRDRYLPYAASGFFENGGRQLYVCRLVGQGATTATLAFGDLAVLAVGAGEFGNRIWALVRPSTTQKKNPDTNVVSPVGFRLTLAYWATVPNNFTPFDPTDVANRMKLPRPTLVEDFDDLTTDAVSSDYFEKRLAGNSALVTILRTAGTDSLPQPGNGLLAGGADDNNVLGSADYVGATGGNRTTVQGLEALKLDAYRDVAIVYAPYPPQQRVEIAVALKDHCELQKFRFAVLDADRNSGDAGALDPRSTIADTSYAAFYYPWYWISDPQTSARTLAPPGGHVVGVYARTDDDRGVFKAPANETPMGVLDLEFAINDEVQAVLNPRGVNVTRSFPGRGIRVWGARTLSSNGLWKYVSVRRLFIFLERSIYEGTQWVVFEPNDDRLWARVKDSIRLFLRTQWRSGALYGATEQQAFFITCDRTTMTQDDILNGRLICEIGIAPVRPAEFVIFRVFQNTAEAQN